MNQDVGNIKSLVLSIKQVKNNPYHNQPANYKDKPLNNPRIKDSVIMYIM